MLSHKRQHGLIHAPHELFGYRREGKRFVPVPHEQVTVQTMRSLRAKGATYREIVAHLNTKAIPTKRGGVWDPGTVREILLRGEAAV